MKFLVHGSIAYDILLHHESGFPDAIHAENIDKLSVGFLAQRMMRQYGGTAANIAWNLRLLKQHPLIVGTIGRDGEDYLRMLETHGISVQYIETKKEALTATAIIATDADERQITFFHPGADALGTLPVLNEEKEDLHLAIVGPRDSVLMQRAVVQCKQLNIPYVFDPGQQTNLFEQDECRRAVTGSRALVVNAYEWALVREKLAWEAEDLLKVCPLLVITDGERGLTLHALEDTVVINACKPTQCINPTGAGDALRAGLLIGLSQGWTLQDTGRLGAAMGSFAVEQEGTLIENLTPTLVRERVFENYGEELPNFEAETKNKK